MECDGNGAGAAGLRPGGDAIGPSTAAAWTARLAWAGNFTLTAFFRAPARFFAGAVAGRTGTGADALGGHAGQDAPAAAGRQRGLRRRGQAQGTQVPGCSCGGVVVRHVRRPAAHDTIRMAQPS